MSATTIFFEPSNDATFADDVALIVAMAGGFVLPRWRDGLIVSAIVVIAAYGFLLGWPIGAVGKAFPWEAFQYGVFWVAVALFYARVLLAFTLAYAMRNLFEVVWRAVQRRVRR